MNDAGLLVECAFNGARDVGADRFDPRYDCREPALWHVLLRDDATVTSFEEHRWTAACHEHVLNVQRSLFTLHVFEAGCLQGGALWQPAVNRCVVEASNG